MGAAMAIVVMVLNSLASGVKLYQALVDTFKRRGELTPEEEALIQKKYDEIFKQPHHQIEPDPLENGR